MERPDEYQELLKQIMVPGDFFFFQARLKGSSRKTPVMFQASKLTLIEALYCILLAPLTG